MYSEMNPKVKGPAMKDQLLELAQGCPPFTSLSAADFHDESRGQRRCVRNAIENASFVLM